MKLVGGIAAACVGFAALAGQGGQGAAASSGATQAKAAEVVAQVQQREQADQKSASRDLPARTFLSQKQAPTAKAAKTPAANTGSNTPMAAAPAQSTTEAAAAPAEPIPVAGLNQIQMNNAKKIVETAKSMGLGERAQVIAVATAMQESTLYNLASTRLPESYDYTNEGQGSDHDSVGLFQQRPSSGWGSVANLMKPEYATKQFLKALVQVPGWEGLPLTVAAQEVQVSAYPDHYAKHETRAAEVVGALNR